MSNPPTIEFASCQIGDTGDREGSVADRDVGKGTRLGRGGLRRVADRCRKTGLHIGSERRDACDFRVEPDARAKIEVIDVGVQIVSDFLRLGVGGLGLGLGVGVVREAIGQLGIIGSKTRVGSRRCPDSTERRLLLEDGDVEAAAAENLRSYEAGDSGADHSHL